MANNNDKFISRENAKTLWGYMIDLLTGKQNKLTFDNTPTQGSDNPVKSGGIFTALAGKGTYSKPQNGIPKTDLENAVQTSLGLADSALQSETDPTVPSWAKASNKPSYTQDEVGDGTTYKRVSQTEKDTWSGKQNALSTTQMQAVNSGITSAKLSLINGSLIDIVNNGTKNYARENNVTYTATQDIRSAIIYIEPISGEIHIHADKLESTDTDSTGCLYILYYTDGTSSDGIFERNVAINIDLDTGNKVVDCIYIYPATNGPKSQNDTITITNFMVTPTSQFGLSDKYEPHALGNQFLTPAVIEQVDSGAKNELQPTWITQTINGVTFTVGSDGVITVTTTGSRTSAAIYPLLSRYSGTKMTGKVMSISPKGGTNASYYVAAEQADSPWHNVGTDYGDGVVISSEANNKDINVNIVIPANYSPNNLKFYPMLCTEAEFRASPKFVPYDTRQWQYIEQWFTSTAADTYEYSGVSFTVPANQVFEFRVLDKSVASRCKGIVVSHSRTSLTSSNDVIAEAVDDYTVAEGTRWCVQCTGMTVKYGSQLTCYIWVKRKIAAENLIALAYRRIY